MPKSITTLWNSLLKMQWGVIIIASVLIVVIEGAIVIMRYFLKADLFDIEEIIVISSFFLYFIGTSVGTHDKKHITAELVSEFVNNEIIKRSIKLISSFITTAVCLVIFYWSLEF